MLVCWFKWGDWLAALRSQCALLCRFGTMTSQTWNWKEIEPSTGKIFRPVRPIFVDDWLCTMWLSNYLLYICWDRAGYLHKKLVVDDQFTAAAGGVRDAKFGCIFAYRPVTADWLLIDSDKEFIYYIFNHTLPFIIISLIL